MTDDLGSTLSSKDKPALFYADLKEKRKEYGISQTKLAEASGYSKAAISAWELEKSVPSALDIQILDQALSKMIQDMEDSIVNIRKKRITSSNKAKQKLPCAINSASEYQMRLSQRKSMRQSAYRDELTALYEKAMLPKHHHAPKAIALFSGCGGLSLGFAAEGFELLGHVEIERSANRIYENNFPNSVLLGEDICSISDEEMGQWIAQYGNIDIVIGGPPCQGFSLAGKRDPEDARNQLYKYYVHAVSVLRPKIFVMENVRLLTSMKNTDGRLFIDCMIESFSGAGYSMIRQELNACDYGVPQSRERVILIGIRKDLNRGFVFPEGEYADSKRENPFMTCKRRLTFRDATADLEALESGEMSADPLHWSIVHPDHVIRWLKDVPEGHSAHENKNPSLRPPSGFNTTYKRIVWDEPCSTISTNFSIISGCRNVHPTSTRSLTIREAARAQSFPDEFVFTGKWGDIRKAIGNAVPPILAASLARAIYEQFFRD